MICLNSVIELIVRAMAITRQVGTSTPVVSSCEVVTIAGVLLSTSENLLRYPRPSSPSFERDPHDVIRIFFHQIRIELLELDHHLGGMFLVDTKDDGFGKAVATSLQEVGQVFCQGALCAVSRQFLARKPAWCTAYPGYLFHYGHARPTAGGNRPNPNWSPRDGHGTGRGNHLQCLALSYKDKADCQNRHRYRGYHPAGAWQSSPAGPPTGNNSRFRASSPPGQRCPGGIHPR